jgi:hypothetical protein
MTYLAILVVMLVAFTVVGWPLITSSGGTRRESRVAPWDDLIGQRDAVYRGIKELDFEHELGNISESDYRRLRQRYRNEAATTLRRLDAAASGGGQVPANGPAASTQTASSDSPQPELPCPSCGKPVEAADRHCWSCGAPLGRRCPNCAVPVEPTHQFCPGCGSHLGEA